MAAMLRTRLSSEKVNRRVPKHTQLGGSALSSQQAPLLVGPGVSQRCDAPAAQGQRVLVCALLWLLQGGMSSCLWCRGSPSRCWLLVLYMFPRGRCILL